jgi:hypothetical protein
VLTYLLLQQEMLFFWFVLKAYNIFLLLKRSEFSCILALKWHCVKGMFTYENIFEFHFLKVVCILSC